MSADTPTQIAFLAADRAELLALARTSVRTLAELVLRYEVARSAAGPGPQITGPADVVALVAPEMVDLAQEQLRVLLLDTKNRVLAITVLYQGTLDSTGVRVGECFREAIARNAASIILVHAHPSGDPTPSPADVALTRTVGLAGGLLDIPLLDHVVVAREGSVSLKERGLYGQARGTSNVTLE